MAIDPNRLFPLLLNTGLAQKDQPLYQLLRELIRSTVINTDSISGIINNGDTVSTTEIINQYFLSSDEGGGGGESDVVPGPQGIQGIQGIQGPIGSMGAIIFPPDAEDGDIFPPIVGPQGNPGPTGNQGPTGNIIYIDDAYEDNSVVQLQPPPTVAGGLVLLEQHAASGSASLNFTTAFSSAYDDYLFEFVSIIPATNAVSMLMRMSTDGGATYDSGNNYRYAYTFTGSSASNGVNNSNSASSIAFSGGLNNASTAGSNGSLSLYNPGSSAVHKIVTFLNGFLANDSNYYRISGMGAYAITTAVNAVQFLMSSGNISSGTIRCYGIAKS